jgi:ribosome-binding protein aMBF1 (putative translation factor)
MGEGGANAGAPETEPTRDAPRSEAEHRARRLLRSLADRRRELSMSQTVVAARMGTSQSSLARIEAGEIDPRLSTVERFALALGDDVQHQPALRHRDNRARGRRSS